MYVCMYVCMYVKCSLIDPQILRNLCFSFLLGITAVPREIESNAYAKFCGANKVHYGRCGSGECSTYRIYNDVMLIKPVIYGL